MSIAQHERAALMITKLFAGDVSPAAFPALAALRTQSKLTAFSMDIARLFPPLFSKCEVTGLTNNPQLHVTDLRGRFRAPSHGGRRSLPSR